MSIHFATESHSPLGEEFALPEQLLPSRSDTWVRRLARAVLNEALISLGGHATDNSGNGEPCDNRRKTRLAAEARDWILSDATDYPHSFVNVCEALGLEFRYFRKRLLSSVPRLREGGKVKVGVHC